MPRQPFNQLRQKNPGGRISVGTFALGQRPELETIIARCLMAWPIAESEMGVFLGQVLGIGNEAALAVFQTLRRYTNQRAAILAAAETALNDTDRELLAAILDVHKSIEAERTALAHGHFGTYSAVPDVILWTTSNAYIDLKQKVYLAGSTLTDEVKDTLFRGIFYYGKNDLEGVQNAIELCADIWVDAIKWVRTRSDERERRYRQLCEIPRIDQALATLRQKSSLPTPPQSPPLGGSETA